MSPVEPSSSGDLPSLPPDLHDELLAVLFRQPAHVGEAVAALALRWPQYADAIDRFVRHHEQLTAADRPASDQHAIAGYRLERQIGEGGMGVVYLAEQLVPVHRRVAIKVIKRGLESQQVVERFERERQALAAMEHDAIARIYDCGTTLRGHPYFAMEYVEGEPIAACADRLRLSLRGRIELFVQVCHGVQHAHQKGVIHRDLKPGNVLVTERDGRRAVKIIDFGLARAVVAGCADGELLTEPGQLLGTPEYMSPEQVMGRQDLFDTRADIYSLGGMLYELVAGVLPFDPGALRVLTPAELRRRLCDGELPRPSTRLSSLGARAGECAERRQRSVSGLWRELRGDLDWIVLRAMAAEPERRYPSAASLAEDLGRYLAGMPVEAGPPSRGYRLKKFARRHRTPLLAVGLLLAAGVAIGLDKAIALDRVRRVQQQVDLLGHVLRLHEAEAGAASLLEAWPIPVAALRDWQRQFAAPLHEAVPAVVAALPELPAQSRASGLEPTAAEYVGQQLEQFVAAHATFERDTVAAVAVRREAGERAAVLLRGHPLQRVTWDEARAAIAAADGVRASRLYAAVPIDLQPQLDLVPIGKNPVTGLFEFYHLPSATPPGVDPATVSIPQHAADGSIAVGEESGIVFVLIPGATATLGAQAEAADAPYFDPGVSAGAHTFAVTLGPYFLARHELTQGQWLRLAGVAAPVRYAPGTRGPGMDAAVDLRHPVEMVDWSQCERLLRRCGLVLPTEAQWENGCRAGTNRSFSFGAAIASLRGFANVLDQRAVGVQPSWRSQIDPADWDDGFVIHAPVGSFPANAFGLHDMHGNVMEWCRDGDDSRTPTWAAGDGLRSGGTGTLRALRGGSFLVPPLYAGCAWRYPYDPNWRSHDLGCRAARPVL